MKGDHVLIPEKLSKLVRKDAMVDNDLIHGNFVIADMYFAHSCIRLSRSLKYSVLEFFQIEFGNYDEERRDWIFQQSFRIHSNLGD